MKGFFAALALLAIPSALAAQEIIPAWERAGRYTCRAEQLRICEGRRSECRVSAGTAVFDVNFGDNTFRVFGSSDEFTEQIVFRKFRAIDRSL